MKTKSNTARSFRSLQRALPKQPGVRRMFTRHLDDTWSWEAAVWLNRDDLFADCMITPRPSRSRCKTKAVAEKALQRVLDGMGWGEVKDPNA